MSALDKLAEARRLAGYWAPLPAPVRDWDHVRVVDIPACPTCGAVRSVRVFVDDPAEDLRHPDIRARFERAGGAGVRAWGCLVRAGWYTRSGVQEADDEDLLAIVNFGRRSLEVTRQVLMRESGGSFS
jgi:hypothetical protein